MPTERPLDQHTPEEAIAAFVDAVRRSPERRPDLVELLPEGAPLYAGRSANTANRIKGYILAAFEQVGLPEAALPYALEELESGRNAYAVAAAAKALRGLESPTGQLVPFLMRAIENVRYVDDAVSFEGFRPQRLTSSHTTALAEILATLTWLGAHARSALPGLEALRTKEETLPTATRAAMARAITAVSASHQDAASCCGAGHSPIRPRQSGTRARRGAPAPNGVELEDQDGRSLTYGDFFCRCASIVVFFYSRCDNPNKCSLTITKLGRLQRLIREAGLTGRLQTAAITYDPAYDLPPRLRAYGENRGVVFGDGDRFFRTPTEFETLRDYFGLGVSFGGPLINRHRIELFVLDDRGQVALTFSRLQWDIEEVLDQARALTSAGAAGHPVAHLEH